MFEKKKDVSEASKAGLDDVSEPIETGTDVTDTASDCGVYGEAIVHTAQSDVVITIPLDEHVVTIRAPQALIVRNAAQAVAGRLLGESDPS
ncbi:MAG: hypothetical protein RDU20_18430 [Desulfomonilaceae bacterium]|nr:hypothetical protein [Desulfomonilaceae bacterium]